MASLPFLHGRESFDARIAGADTGLHNDSAARRQQRRNRGVDMSVNPQNGLIHLACLHTVEETIQRFVVLLSERGFYSFARVDHSGEAAKVGLAMRPTKLLI